MGHRGPVLCCMWSPLKPQLIITGSSDFMLSIWNFTCPEQSPKPFSEERKKQHKHKTQKYKIPNGKTIVSETNGKPITNNSTNLTDHSADSTSEKTATGN